MTSLRCTQQWFAQLITAPESPSDGHCPAAWSLPGGLSTDVDRRIAPGPGAGGASERLAVYQAGYRARLIECLADDYPAVAAHLGEDRFHRLADGYITAHPSRSFSLNRFGGRLVDYLSQYGARQGWTDAAFVRDLAKLEWTIVEVIHAGIGRALTLTEFADSLEADPNASLRASGSARLVWTAHPVNRHYQAFREDSSTPPVTAEPAATLVFRVDKTVWRADLPIDVAQVVDALLGGEPYAKALERLGAGGEPALTEAELRFARYLREWIDAGIFAAAEG